MKQCMKKLLNYSVQSVGAVDTPTASLQRGKTLPTSVLDMTLKDPEFWGMQSTFLLPLLPGQLWRGVIAPDRVLSLSKIKLWHLNCVQTNDSC